MCERESNGLFCEIILIACVRETQYDASKMVCLHKVGLFPCECVCVHVCRCHGCGVGGCVCHMDHPCDLRPNWYITEEAKICSS